MESQRLDNALKRLCVIHNVRWILEENQILHINDEEHEQVLAVVQSVIEKSISEDVAERLPRNIAQQKPYNIMKQVPQILVNRSRARQMSLHQAVKLRRGCAVA